MGQDDKDNKRIRQYGSHLGSLDDPVSLRREYRTESGYPVRVYAIDCGGYFTVHGAYWIGGGADRWVATEWTELGATWDMDPIIQQRLMLVEVVRK